MPTYREALRRLPACTSSSDTLALAQWVFSQMQQPEQSSKPEDQQQGDQPGNEQGDGQGDGQGDQTSDQQGDQQGQQQGQDGAGDDGEGESQGDTPEDAGEARKPRPNSHSMEVEPQGPATKGDTGGTFTAQANEAGWPESQQARSLDVAIPGGLRYQVRRLFENTAQDWVEPGYRSGRLNPGALHRVPNGGEDVFTRRFERDGIDSAAVLLLDMSGSMWGALDNNVVSKIDVAAACTWALAETLMQAGVDVAILGFDNDLYRLRDFGSTPALKTRATLERIRTGGSTNDYAAIRLAHQMLLRHHATRRVAFVLGDGVGDRANASRQVTQGENLGISTIGIGIGYDVRSVYGAGSVRVDRPADLGRVAFQKMKGAA
jgi:Mg-chelatase subunit ChlD